MRKAAFFIVDTDPAFADIVESLTRWLSAGPLGDSNKNGIVDFGDILSTLTFWGTVCTP